MAGAAFWGNAANEGPTFSSDPWDKVYLGGTALPGICEVKGLAQLELDKKKQKGTNGLTLTVTGYQPGPFEVVCTVWTQAQWEYLLGWIDLYWLTPQAARPQFTKTKKRTGSDEKTGKSIFKEVTTKNRQPQVAIDIQHPAVAAIGITSCTIQGVSIPESASADGVKAIHIKVVENRPSEAKTITKTARDSSAGNLTADPHWTGKAEKNRTPQLPSQVRSDLGPNGAAPKPGGGTT